MPQLTKVPIKIFADSAEFAEMVALAENPLIEGFTTNPTLMRRAGVTDYAAFAKNLVAAIPNKPISFEVFADDFSEMERQAQIIASWGTQVYVKIPIMNTYGEPSTSLIRKLARMGVKVNVTAILTEYQVMEVAQALSPGVPAIVSIFAGRIADNGSQPQNTVMRAYYLLHRNLEHEILWASCREVFNIFDASHAKADIITVSPEIFKKFLCIDRSLYDISLDTVQMFYADAQNAGYTL